MGGCAARNGLPTRQQCADCLAVVFYRQSCLTDMALLSLAVMQADVSHGQGRWAEILNRL